MGLKALAEKSSNGLNPNGLKPNELKIDIPPSCDTVPKIWYERVERFGARVALYHKNLGIWKAYSWQDYGDIAKWCGLALDALGLKSGDRVAITSEVCPEWLFTDLAVMAMGGVSFGIYPTDAPKQIEYIVNDCQARFYFAENDEQLDKLLEVRDQLPSLKKIIVFDMEGLHKLDDPMVMGFEQLIKLGKTRDKEKPNLFSEKIAATKPDETAILVYTSGTTGPPKGAMISHENILFHMRNNQEILPYHVNDRSLAFLPLCHIAERTFTTFTQLATGHVVYFSEDSFSAMDNLREVSPTIFFAVPRIWEKFFSSITIMLKEATWLENWFYRLAMKIGKNYGLKKMEGEEISFQLDCAFRLADFFVLTNIKRALGIADCRLALSGAAPISPELIAWYYALGIYMVEGYGQTENSGIASLPMPYGAYKKAMVGKALPNTQIKLAPDGEILIYGPHVFQGYWNQPQKTAETIIDGWLHSGDIGFIDNEGWLKITGRKKDIIITAGGKNITPSEIENELKFSPYIQDAVVIGDQRKFLSALIMIDQDNVTKFAQDHLVPFSDFASLCRAKAILDLINGEILKVNQSFARVEQIKGFRLIDHLILPDDDEITATGKLKRSFVSEKYKALIDDIYQKS